MWRCFNDLPGSALVLSLEDKGLDAALEIDVAKIAKDDGVDATQGGHSSQNFKF